jgi:arabinofuranosyltransferase
MAAHATAFPDGRPGHDKYIGPAWEVASLAQGNVQELAARGGFTVEQLTAIQRTLNCPHNKEMLDSARAPLTFSRFWDNLVHSVGRSGLRYDNDPLKAQPCN